MTNQADFAVKARIALHEELVDAITLSLDDPSDMFSVCRLIK